MPYEPGCGMSIDQPHFEPPEPARELVPESAPEPVIGRRAEIARYALRLCKSSAWPSTPPKNLSGALHNPSAFGSAAYRRARPADVQAEWAFSQSLEKQTRRHIEGPGG